MGQSEFERLVAAIADSNPQLSLNANPMFRSIGEMTLAKFVEWHSKLENPTDSFD